METPTPECSEEIIDNTQDTQDTPEFTFPASSLPFTLAQEKEKNVPAENSSLDLLATAALLKTKITTITAEEALLLQKNQMASEYENFLLDLLGPAEETENCTFLRMESMEAPTVASDLEDGLDFLDKIDLENPINETSPGYTEEILEGEVDVKIFNEVPEIVQNEKEKEKEPEVQNNGQNYSPVTSPELENNSPINLTVPIVPSAQEIPISESEEEEDKKVKNKPKPSKRRGRTPKKKLGRPPGKKVKNSPPPTPKTSTPTLKRKDIMLLKSLGLTPNPVKTPKTPAELKNLAINTPEYSRNTSTPLRRAATRNINYNEEFLVQRNNQMTIMAQYIQNKSTPTKKRGRKPKRTNILNTIQDQNEENSAGKITPAAAAGNITPDDASSTAGDIAVADYLEPPAGTIATTSSTAGDLRNNSVAGIMEISNGKEKVAGGSDISTGEAEEALNLDQIDDDDENVKDAGEEETETEEEYINGVKETETEEETESDKHLDSEEEVEEDFKYF